MTVRRVLFITLVAILVGSLTAVVLLGALGYQARLREPVLSQQLNGAGGLSNVVQDQGISVTLADGRVLWLFADTAKVTGRPVFFVTSSAAITRGRSLDLTYLTGPGGSPIEFLPRTPAERAGQTDNSYTAVWPYGATLLPDGRVLVSYVKYAVTRSPEGYDFLGAGLYAYTPPSGQDPARATPAVRIADDIWGPADGPVASPTFFNGQVYFLTCPDFTCFMVRTTPAGLTDRTSYRWWTGAGWDADRGRATKLSFGSDVPGKNPAMVFDRRDGVFVIADTTGGIQSTSGLFWVAQDPWGPWSRAAPFPLPQCPTRGCYTLNPHPDQSSPGTLRVSFATYGMGPYVRVVDVPVAVAGGVTPSIDTGS